MLNLDGAHTLQAELRSLHRKPRGYVEEGPEAEDLLAAESEAQPKQARQTSLAGFFAASPRPAALCSAVTAAAAATVAAAAESEEPAEAEGEEEEPVEPAWVASGGKTLEVVDELVAQPVTGAVRAGPQPATPALSGQPACMAVHVHVHAHVQVAHVLARDGATLFTAAERAWLGLLVAGAAAEAPPEAAAAAAAVSAAHPAEAAACTESEEGCGLSIQARGSCT